VVSRHKPAKGYGDETEIITAVWLGENFTFRPTFNNTWRIFTQNNRNKQKFKWLLGIFYL